MKRCVPRKKTKVRHRVNLAIDQELWNKFQPVLRELWEGSFNSWVEFAMECYSRDTCEGCPYNEPGHETDKGIGKKLKHRQNNKLK
jgi:hypothetical protein